MEKSNRIEKRKLVREKIVIDMSSEHWCLCRRSELGFVKYKEDLSLLNYFAWREDVLW